MAKGKKTGGRERGTLNKNTVEIREAARALLQDPDYLAQLKIRLFEGRAGPVEPLLYHYGYGKPKERIELEGAAPMPLVIELITNRAQLGEPDPDDSDEDE